MEKKKHGVETHGTELWKNFWMLVYACIYFAIYLLYFVITIIYILLIIYIKVAYTLNHYWITFFFCCFSATFGISKAMCFQQVLRDPFYSII